MKTDREQNQELVATYANSIDAKDYDRLMGCFTADATAEYGVHSNLLKGQNEILAHMKKMLEPLDGTQHLLTNFIINIDGDNAKLTADSLGHHWRHGASGGQSNTGGGKYTVELRRAGGKWQFTKVSTRSLWTEGNQALVPKIK
jgi:ketosteroid isomerase-like protein